MAKGWTVLETVNDRKNPITEEQKKRNRKNFAKAIKNAEDARLKDVDKDLERLKKEGEDLYWTRFNEEEKLLDAYKNKKVKSKEAIKRAKKLIKDRAEAEKKKKVAAEKNESNVKAEA